MNDTFYSVEELSHILNLHPKTVRRFIREGKIRGKKIGRAWKVHQDDLREFAHGELKTDEDKTVRNTQPPNRNRITVSAVVEVWEKEYEEASRISNSLIAMLNTKDPSWGETRYDLIYHPEIGKARFILYGTPAFIGAVMNMFTIINKQS